MSSQAAAPHINALREVGYLVVPRLAPLDLLRELNRAARAQLAVRTDPLELEVDLHYPGAPPSRSAEGGETVRRLLDAYGRDPSFAAWARAPVLQHWFGSYFGEPVLMSRAHHNCVMTKHPRHGSLTNWHRDIRYWSVEREDLVSVWLALGEETVENGGLWFVPGSHRMSFDADRFDSARFFRADRPDNAQIIQTARSPRLEAGDAVFFHCNTLHSAGKNMSTAVKFSLVYTYHGRSNAPSAGSRSAAKSEIEVTEGVCDSQSVRRPQRARL